MADWTPRVDNPEWSAYLAALAAAADQRVTTLGAETAEQEPRWAVDAFGPVPVDVTERAPWERQAGTVAAYRELRGHDDDTDVLGRAPAPGQVEAYAAYRAAWHALGRPEVDQAAHELSNGQLRVRMRAWQRELPWAPRYVANELAGTRQAAAAQRQTATLRAAEAAVAADPVDRARLEQEAGQAAALADTLDTRAGELQALDDARAQYLAHTAMTRAEAQQAEMILAERHALDDEPEQRVTADEWLAAHRDAIAEDEHHRVVTEDDVVEQEDGAAREHDAVRHVDPDLRETAAADPGPVAEDVVRVPSADEVVSPVDQANRALAEMCTRGALDEREATEHRAEQLIR